MYCYWHHNKDKHILEILEIISCLLCRFDKMIIQAPTHEEVNSYLQDSKNTSIKRICLQQNALILIPNYLILATMPFKVKSITPFAAIQDIYTQNETLIISSEGDSLTFNFDTNKRATDWMREIESLILPKSYVCSQCGEANLLKRIVNCAVCSKRICVLCECRHN